ncbi:MAG TPA: hypothetical protein VFH95_01905 [Candidatus Kapabacteria bacterium]|nr:hypothetical protein [Candidatus Kapabacteria bacterium]
MRRITTLLTFSFIFLFAGEYANAQYPAPGTRPHSGVPVASIPATIPGAGSGSIPTYTSQRPGTIPGSIPNRSAYQPAPAYRNAPAYRPAYSGQTYTPVYRGQANVPNRVYVPSSPQYVPVYVPSAPVYTQAPVYVTPEPVYVPSTDREGYRRDHQRWEEERAHYADRDHDGAAYRGGEHAGAAQAQARAENARGGNGHADHGRHLGWDKNGQGGDQR